MVNIIAFCRLVALFNVIIKNVRTCSQNDYIVDLFNDANFSLLLTSFLFAREDCIVFPTNGNICSNRWREGEALLPSSHPIPREPVDLRRYHLSLFLLKQKLKKKLMTMKCMYC